MNFILLRELGVSKYDIYLSYLNDIIILGDENENK